jgi:hypothetical protein
MINKEVIVMWVGVKSPKLQPTVSEFIIKSFPKLLKLYHEELDLDPMTSKLIEKSKEDHIRSILIDDIKSALSKILIMESDQGVVVCHYQNILLHNSFERFIIHVIKAICKPRSIVAGIGVPPWSEDLKIKDQQLQIQGQQLTIDHLISENETVKSIEGKLDKDLMAHFEIYVAEGTELKEPENRPSDQDISGGINL